MIMIVAMINDFNDNANVDSDDRNRVDSDDDNNNNLK